MKTSGLLLLSCLFPVSITGESCGSCINAGKKFHSGKCYAPDEDCPQDGAACCATKECCRLRRKTCKKCTKSGHTFQWNGRFQRSHGTCYEDSSGAAVCDPASDPSCCDGLKCCKMNRSVLPEPEPVDYCEACVRAGRPFQGGACEYFIDGDKCPIADLDCCTELGCCGLKPQNEIGNCDSCVSKGFMWEKSGPATAVCTDVVGNMIEPGTCPGEEESCCTPDSVWDCCLARFPTVSEPEPVDYCEACVREGRPFQGGACKEFIDGDKCPIGNLECCTELACCGPKP